MDTLFYNLDCRIFLLSPESRAFLETRADGTIDSPSATAIEFHSWQAPGAGILMATHLPKNQFISNSTVSPRAVGSAVALIAPPVADATAAPFDEPSMTNGGDQETPASAPSKNPDAGVLDAIDCIHEIFHYARKLMRGHQGFVLDEAEFMADVEEEPLFLRDGDHLRRWEA